MSTPKEILAEIVPILTKDGVKAPFGGGATEYKLGEVTLLDNEFGGFHIIFSPEGSVTERKGGRHVWFRDGMDASSLKSILEDLKQNPQASAVAQVDGGQVKKSVKSIHFKP